MIPTPISIRRTVDSLSTAVCSNRGFDHAGGYLPGQAQQSVQGPAHLFQFTRLSQASEFTRGAMVGLVIDVVEAVFTRLFESASVALPSSPPLSSPRPQQSAPEQGQRPCLRVSRETQTHPSGAWHPCETKNGQRMRKEGGYAQAKAKLDS